MWALIGIDGSSSHFNDFAIAFHKLMYGFLMVNTDRHIYKLEII